MVRKELIVREPTLNKRIVRNYCIEFDYGSADFM